MIKGFYNTASLENKSVIAIDALHAQANTRLLNAQLRLDPKSAFAKANMKHQHNPDSLLGGILLNMLSWGILMGGLEELVGTDLDIHHDGVLAAGLEVYDMISDEFTKRARRKLDLYPEGRRADVFEKSSMHGKFNLIAANENDFFANDAEKEVIALTALLDMLEDMAKKGVRTINIDPKQPVYKTLTEARRKSKSDGIFTNYGLSMRKAV